MAVRLMVVAGYFVVLLGIGFWARHRSRGTTEDYFLASRSLSPIVLFLTMAATNFSAFTVFGFSGAGWEAGYSYYPVMAFGTGFMALTFFLIGRPAWRIGKTHGLVTPPEMVYLATGSRTLRLVFFAVMAVFTVPYLAMQPIAAGYALNSLLGIPYFAGAALITSVMLLYTFLGGFRGVTWTDAFQGSLMIVLLLLAVAFIAGRFGGLTAANLAAAEGFPELFSRPGLGGIYTPGVWLGYMLLWFLADPMLPQLFQRFYAANDLRALSTTASLYPLLTGFLFLLPVTIGVLGRLSFPSMETGISADQILPMMLQRHAPPVLEALVLTAALAALMSTLDSQLLTLSSMFSRDIVAPARRYLSRRKGEAPPASDELPTWIGKSFVAGLALIGLAIAWQPPETFRVLATKTFTGLAVLFPTVVATLYWKRTRAGAAILSILVGEALVVVDHFGLLPSLGTLPVVPIVLAATLVLILGSFILPSTSNSANAREPRALSRRALLGWSLAFAALFFVANDVWNWKDARVGWLGYPWWVWVSAGLCIAVSVALWIVGHQLARSSTD